MKKLILPVIFLFVTVFSNPVIAQDDSQKQFNTQKTEFNIAIDNIFSKSSLWPYYYIDGNGDYIYSPYSIFDYQPLTKLKVGLKFHNPTGAVRLGTTFHYTNRKNEYLTGSKEISEYKEFEAGIYLGYEWHSTFSRVNIYYGFDLSSNYFNYKYNSEYQSRTSDYELTEYTFGVNPLLGVNFFITPHLSVGTEVKLMFEYAHGKSKSTNTSDYSTNESESKANGFRTRFGPLGFLSFNIHF